MHDQEIIEMIRSDKSDKALDALYKFFPPIRKHIRNNGGNRQDAEDIFQEALIILCRKTDLVLTAKLSTYLFRVCHLLWKDELRKKKHIVHNDTDVSELPEEEADVRQEWPARLAEKVLAELGDRCRELLLYYYHARMKLKDIAVKMGYSSENTAKNQKYKCLETAKKNLCVMNSK